LRELLIEFHKHSFLRGKLVLKGGTALNLFYLNLARLSVDIDLNYIGHIDREATLLDRPEIIKAIEQVAAGLGYRLQNGTDDYALREWHLNFTNHAGRADRVQVEVNFLMRACALPPQLLDAATIAGAAPCQYLVLGIKELFGGKIKAMIDRHHPRPVRSFPLFERASHSQFRIAS
jgi:predicted nucleotidyltransferase component of viral defense system